MDASDFMNEVTRLALYFVYLAIGQFTTIFVATLGFSHVSDNIAAQIRTQYLTSLLSQNVAYFDRLGSGEIVSFIFALSRTTTDSLVDHPHYCRHKSSTGRHLKQSSAHYSSYRNLLRRIHYRLHTLLETDIDFDFDCCCYSTDRWRAWTVFRRMDKTISCFVR